MRSIAKAERTMTSHKPRSRWNDQDWAEYLNVRKPEVHNLRRRMNEVYKAGIERSVVLGKYRFALKHWDAGEGWVYDHAGQYRETLKEARNDAMQKIPKLRLGMMIAVFLEAPRESAQLIRLCKDVERSA
ncbi:MAG: hypothetical protein LBT92_03360 [Rickettsiales bacterium]|jgi:hypothetical protein|nr:hypothetical protein [Rickettsiales bacterium]